MQDGVLRNVRVLIVEDEEDQLEAFKLYLDTIDEASRLAWGINSFQSTLACSVEEATASLDAAADLPYDILILDLGLPQKKGDTISKTENGQELLARIGRKEAKEVLIVSITQDYEYVIKAVRKGAVDFIRKPFNKQLFQGRVIESWKRVLEKDSVHLQQERIKELVHYNERGFAYRHTVCFNKFAAGVLQETTKLEEHVYNRYGLNRKRDSQDSLIQSIAALEATVNGAKQKWLKLQLSSLPSDDAHHSDVKPMLEELERSLLPCLIVKKLRLELLSTSETNVLTFQRDVQAILKEVLSGAMVEMPDYDSPRQNTDQERFSGQFPNLISVEVSSESGQARVKFTDNLAPMSGDDAEQLNTGSVTVSGQRFSRVWGLAVMQHIAVLGGGRLVVEPQKHGNVVTVLMPLVNDA